MQSDPKIVVAEQGDSKPAPERDFVALARQCKRAEFVAECTFPFLVSTSLLVPQRAAARTVGLLDDDDDGNAGVGGPGGGRFASRPLAALAIRKVTDASPERITVGRTRGNDIVVDHVRVSSLHAFFRAVGRGFELVDAGSRNGTWVSGRLLTPTGPPSPVLESGDSVRFGELDFTFMSPAACWDVLRVNVR